MGKRTHTAEPYAKTNELYKWLLFLKTLALGWLSFDNIVAEFAHVSTSSF